MLSRSGIRRQIQVLAVMAFASIAVSIFDAGCLASPAGAAQPATLEIGSSHSAELKADQRLEFRVMLEAGRAYLFEIDQGGLDVMAELRAETGVTERFDFPTARNDIELFMVEPDTAGGFELSLHVNEFTGAVAHPVITVRQVDPVDVLLPAYRLLTDAAASNGNGPGLLATEEQPWMNNPYLLTITLPPLAAVVLKPQEPKKGSKLEVQQAESPSDPSKGVADTGGEAGTGTENRQEP